MAAGFALFPTAVGVCGLAWNDHYSYLFQMPQWDPSQEQLGLPAELDMLALTQWIDAP